MLCYNYCISGVTNHHALDKRLTNKFNVLNVIA